MVKQYADSDSLVKAPNGAQFRITVHESPNVLGVARDYSEKQPEPVSEFIRLLLDRWQGSGKLLKDLAEQAGLAKSMPSQIKARTSEATLYSATRLAGPLGYADLPELVVAAYKWWASPDRTQIPETTAASPQADAIRLAKSYSVTEAQIARVLERYPIADFEHKDALWWLTKFHEERSLDAERLGEERAEKYTSRVTSNTAKKKRAEIRATKDAIPPATRRSPARRKAS